VIQLALDNNRDLRLAALNVEKVQAQYRLQRAAQYPTASVGVSVDAYRMPADMTNNDKAYTFDSNTVGPQVSSWELDLFGRIRNLKEQALEQYLATEQGRIASQISLVASVAGSYLSLAGDRGFQDLVVVPIAAHGARQGFGPHAFRHASAPGRPSQIAPQDRRQTDGHGCSYVRQSITGMALPQGVPWQVHRRLLPKCAELGATAPPTNSDHRRGVTAFSGAALSTIYGDQTSTATGTSLLARVPFPS